MMTRSVNKASAADAGCWIDGHWGQYGIARLIQIAGERGRDQDDLDIFADAHLRREDLIDRDFQAMMDGAEEVEQWLNDHVAPAGYVFGWHDGEFFLQSAEWWEEA